VPGSRRRPFGDTQTQCAAAGVVQRGACDESVTKLQYSARYYNTIQIQTFLHSPITSYFIPRTKSVLTFVSKSFDFFIVSCCLLVLSLRRSLRSVQQRQTAPDWTPSFSVFTPLCEYFVALFFDNNPIVICTSDRLWLISMFRLFRRRTAHLLISYFLWICCCVSYLFLACLVCSGDLLIILLLFARRIGFDWSPYSDCYFLSMCCRRFLVVL
jgi:hypothetical protein